MKARSLRSGLSVSLVAHESTSEIIFWADSVGFFRKSLTVAVSSCSWTWGRQGGTEKGKGR